MSAVTTTEDVLNFVSILWEEMNAVATNQDMQLVLMESLVKILMNVWLIMAAAVISVTMRMELHLVLVHQDEFF